MVRVLLFTLLGSCLIGCSPKYSTHRSGYTFKSPDGKPDYTILDYWAAHPFKRDPSDSISAALDNAKRDTLADVFFLHPTSYTRKIVNGKLNAPIDDAAINSKTDYTSMLYQASVFNLRCRVFAPRYRQAHIKTFFLEDSVTQQEFFDTAYADIKKAFEHYLNTWNKGQPIIIAGHSQGSKFAELLLKEFFENKLLVSQLVAAYIPGWSVPKEYFTSLKMCEDSIQTGCVCSWRTVRNNYVPKYLRFEKGNSYVTNPLTWTSDDNFASRQLNMGSILIKYNKLYRHTTGARAGNGFLNVPKPKFPWSFLYLSKNYHAGDFNLFYLSVQENVSARINAFYRRR